MVDASVTDALDRMEHALLDVRVRTLMQLARAHRSNARFAEAERRFQEAISLAEVAYRPRGRELRSLLNDLGMTYKYAGRYDEAEELYRRALTLVEPDEVDAASIWHNLG